MPSENTQFKPGSNGGPGRPTGSRNKLSEAFLKALCDDFEEHGTETIQKLIEDDPDKYCNVIARLMPNLLELSGSISGGDFIIEQVPSREEQDRQFNKFMSKVISENVE